jgi:hypothetical protein
VTHDPLAICVAWVMRTMNLTSLNNMSMISGSFDELMVRSRPVNLTGCTPPFVAYAKS